MPHPTLKKWVYMGIGCRPKDVKWRHLRKADDDRKTQVIGIQWIRKKQKTSLFPPKIRVDEKNGKDLRLFCDNYLTKGKGIED